MARCSFYPKQWPLEVSTSLTSSLLDTKCQEQPGGEGVKSNWLVFSFLTNFI